MTGLIVGAEYNAQTTLSGFLTMVMAHLKTIANIDAMFVNHFATNMVKTAQIHSWGYVEVTSIGPAYRNSDSPHGYISVVNKSSQQMFSLLTLYIRLSQRLLAPMQ